MRNTYVRMLIILTVVCVASWLFFTQFRSVTEQPSLTKAEVETRVAQLYVGEVKSVNAEDDAYIVSFEKDKAIYEVQVNKETGMFSELALIFEPPAEPSQVGTEENSGQPDPILIQPATDATKLPKQKIIAIAQKQLQGEVDSVDFYETTDGGYYLVEIETPEDEATFQIHAITGKILSISFDD